MDPAPRLSRRAVLASSLGSLGALAGCTTDGSGAAPSGSTPTDEPASGCAEPAAIDPDAALSELSAIDAAPGDCPAASSPTWERYCGSHDVWFCENVEPTDALIVCQPAAGDAPLELLADASHVDLPGAIGFTVRNRTSKVLRINHYAWHLWKRHEDTWYRVAPYGYRQPAMQLKPGRIHHYCLQADNTSAAGRHLWGAGEAESGVGTNRWQLEVPGLGGGEYAFGLFVGSPALDRDAGLIARFSLGGDPVEVTPTGMVENVAHDGDAVTGEWTLDPDPEHGVPHEFELRRVSSAPNAVRILPEDLLRSWPKEPIRDMVALAREYDAAVVRVRAWNFISIRDASPPVPFELDGQVYETAVREL